jgi:colanic acid biosynthesis glycosyl transferase WcaI
MKIAYLAQHFLPEIGAGPARVAEMVRRWKAAGAEVTIITGMPHRPEGRIHRDYRGKLWLEEAWEGSRVLRSWLYASPRHGFARTIANNASFMVSSALNALANAGKCDVIIASSPPFFVHPAGEMLRRSQRVPLVLEIRDLWPDYLVGMGVLKDRWTTRALFGLERYLLRRAQKVVVVTESFRERVIGKGVPPHEVEVIPNGVDTDFYFASSEPPPLPELRCGPGEFLVGYLGNFGAGQGLEVVLEAASLLKESHPHVRFVMVGDGTRRESVAARARELRLPNLSIHPSLPKEQTRAFYNACDVCLVPLAPFDILQETIPSKIFEVMACERPLIASVGGEAARIVDESGAGAVAAPGDAGTLAAAIIDLHAMPQARRAALGSRGRDFVGRYYSRGALADRYLELLAEVTDLRPRLPRAPAYVSDNGAEHASVA